MIEFKVNLVSIPVKIVWYLGNLIRELPLSLSLSLSYSIKSS